MLPIAIALDAPVLVVELERQSGHVNLHYFLLDSRSFTQMGHHIHFALEFTSFLLFGREAFDSAIKLVNVETGLGFSKLETAFNKMGKLPVETVGHVPNGVDVVRKIEAFRS